jgi:hypothetical protein
MGLHGTFFILWTKGFRTKPLLRNLDFDYYMYGLTKGRYPCGNFHPLLKSAYSQKLNSKLFEHLGRFLRKTQIDLQLNNEN